MNVANEDLCEELYKVSGDTEEWKQIEGLPNYEVSNRGQIRYSKNKRIRKLWYNKDGYASWSVHFGGRPKSIDVHRIVAKHFVEGGEGQYHVNHKDSNPAHNCSHNLEWVTPGENVEHSRTVGKADRYQNRGEKHGMSKLKRVDVLDIRQSKGDVSGAELARYYKVSPQCIYDIWNGRRWKNVT